MEGKNNCGLTVEEVKRLKTDGCFEGYIEENKIDFNCVGCPNFAYCASEDTGEVSPDDSEKE